MKKTQKIEDYINLLYHKPKNRLEIFLSIPEKKRTSVFLRLRRHLQYQVLKEIPKEDVIKLLESLDPDDATDALQLLDSKTQKDLMKELTESIQDQLGVLLKYDQQTAGGLMSLNYIQVNSSDTVLNTAKKFKVHEKRTGKPPEIIVLKNGKIMGYFPTHQLGFVRSNELIGKYVKRINTIKHQTSEKEVLNIFRSHPHSKLAVVDDKSNVIGIIYSDDVLKILKEQGSTLYDFAGVHDEEDVSDPARLKIKFRYKWLIINLATAFLAAFTVSLFKTTLDKYVLLAVYMPIVAGMGGNAGTQTLAVMVRGIALKQINFTNFVGPLFAELSSGFVNGIINGILVFVIVTLLNKDIKLAFVLAIAMTINLLVAAFFGTMVPLFMKRLGKDPASSATIFITTATDVLGFLAFLGLATTILG